MGAKAKVSMISGKTRPSNVGGRHRTRRDDYESGHGKQDMRDVRQERRNKDLSWQEEFMKVMASDLREIRAAMKNFATKEDLQTVKADVKADVKSWQKAEADKRQMQTSVGEAASLSEPVAESESVEEMASPAEEISSEEAVTAENLPEPEFDVEEIAEEPLDLEPDTAAEETDTVSGAVADDGSVSVAEETVGVAPAEESWAEPVELTTEEIETLTAKSGVEVEQTPETSDTGADLASERPVQSGLSDFDLAEEINPAQLAAFATKEDLRAVQDDVKSLLETIGGLGNTPMKFVTKEDLQEVKEDVRQLQDSVDGLKEEQKNFSTKEDIRQLQETVEHLLGDMHGFVSKDDIMSLQYSVNDFKTDMSNFITKEDIHGFRETIEGMKEDYKAIKSDSLVLKKSIDSVKENFRYMGDSIKERDKRLEHMIDERIEKLEGMYKQSQMMALVTIVVVLAIFAAYLAFGK